MTDTQEQAVLQTLRTLPIAVIITPRDESTYIWQCLDRNGSTSSLTTAMSEGLSYMTQAVVGDATVIDDVLTSSRLN